MVPQADFRRTSGDPCLPAIEGWVLEAGEWSLGQTCWRGLPVAQTLPPNLGLCGLSLLGQVNVLYARKAISGEGLGCRKDP